MTTTTRPLVLTVTEAGNLLGISRSTAYELVRSGDLESVQLRRRIVVPVAAIAKRLGIAVPDLWIAMSDAPHPGLSSATPTADRLGRC